MYTRREECPPLLFTLNRILWIAALFIIAGIPIIINPTAFDYFYQPKVDSLYSPIIIIFSAGLWKTMGGEREKFRKILFCCMFSAFFGYLIKDLFIFSVVSVSPTFWSLIGMTLVFNHYKINLNFMKL